MEEFAWNQIMKLDIQVLWYGILNGDNSKKCFLKGFLLTFYDSNVCVGLYFVLPCLHVEHLENY